MEGQTTRGRPRREWLDDVGLHSEKEGARQRHVETIVKCALDTMQRVMTDEPMERWMDIKDHPMLLQLLLDISSTHARTRTHRCDVSEGSVLIF